MTAIRLLRSQISLLNSSKFELLRPSVNSLIIHIQHYQNPNFFRHFRPNHSITPNSSPKSPRINVNGASKERTSESRPRSWSVFSNPQSKPTNSIRSVDSNGEKGSRKGRGLREDNPEKTQRSNHPNGNRQTSYQKSPAKTTSLNRGLESVVLGNKMNWVCADCGHSTAQWWGTCQSCNKFGTLNKFPVSKNKTSENMMNAPVRLMGVTPGIDHIENRIRLPGLFGLEINRVLGGGVVPGSLILVGGNPGVGKSTLALQMAALIAVSIDVGGAAPVLYISGEESVEQIRNRADQLSIETEDLFFYSSTVIEDILGKAQLLSPRAVVVDSIQSVYVKGVAGSPGGLMQVEDCTFALLHFARKTNIPVLLIGHVNKNGEIAGPRDMERIVDVVLYMEGEKHPSHRLLRSVKNRFGSIDEMGVIKMSKSGLEAVSNPSEMFLSKEHSDSENLTGLAIALIIDGSRSFPVEVQALCVCEALVSRFANGVQLSRAGLISSVLKNQVGLKLDDYSIFLNVISGVSLTETSGDLAVAAAICSSFLEFPLPNHLAFIGEVGLGGELLMVPRIEKSVITLAKLGYKKCVVPESVGKALAAISSDIQIVGCKNLKEVIDKVFRRLD